MKKRTIAVSTLLAALSCAPLAKADNPSDDYKTMPQNTTFVFCQNKTPDAKGCKITFPAIAHIVNPYPAMTPSQERRTIYCLPDQNVVTASTDISDRCGIMLQL